MTFLSKQTILQAYSKLSKLTSDPSAQGATQVTSSLRYLFALDRFYKYFGRPCDTKNRSDRDYFIEFVGEIVRINDQLYTANFYNSLKDNADFAVGSNFFSVNTVKNSLENRSKEYDFPKRGNNPLFIIKDGELIEKPSYLDNIDTILYDSEIKQAFCIWLVRDMEVDSSDIYASIGNNLKKRYSDNLISKILPAKAQFKVDESFAFDEIKPILSMNDFANIHRKSNNSNLIYGKRLYTFASNSDLLHYLPTLRTKPFLLLAGISGTGKSRIVRKLAQATVTEDLQREYEGKYTWDAGTFNTIRWDLHRPANFELIQVKPNWHNSMDVVGYLSNIPAPHYVFTTFTNFIVRAMCHPEVPFFLCLDEMNLAPVEEYFAEFLSAIESRGKKDGKYFTDPIIPPFNTYGDIVDEKGRKSNVGETMLKTLSEIIDKEIADPEKQDEIRTHLKEKGLTLPENLIIIGTVNMDETTFSFSRKVLDRAMSIEMNKVDYSSFLSDSTDDDIKAIAEAFKTDEDDTTGNNSLLNKLLIDRHVQAKEIVPELGGAAEGSDAKFVINYLETINKLLDGTPFKLGYRAANEALIYLRSSQEFGNNDRNDAMDKFTLMKILSRIEGDESKLKLSDADSKRLESVGVDYSKISGEFGGATILSALREIIAAKLGESQITKTTDESKSDDGESETDENTSGITQEVSPRDSIKKLDSMIAQLDRDHFVSYWS